MIRVGFGFVFYAGRGDVSRNHSCSENAPDLSRKLESTVMPFLEPSRNESDRELEAFARILRCWVYLGQSLKMRDLVSVMLISHGHRMGRL